MTNSCAKLHQNPFTTFCVIYAMDKQSYKQTDLVTQPHRSSVKVIAKQMTDWLKCNMADNIAWSAVSTIMLMPENPTLSTVMINITQLLHIPSHSLKFSINSHSWWSVSVTTWKLNCSAGPKASTNMFVLVLLLEIDEHKLLYWTGLNCVSIKKFLHLDHITNHDKNPIKNCFRNFWVI